MHKFIFYLQLFLLIIAPVCLAESNLNPATCKFENVKPNYNFTFPKDHGAHNRFPSEWWYFTGHLYDQNQKTYGFELTFFRVALKPCITINNPWESSQLYIAHAALTDDQGNKFYHDHQMSRGNFDLADASESNLDVKLLNWSAKMHDQQIQLHAQTKEFSFELNLNTNKPLVFHGFRGYSQKLPGEKNASYYTSFTRLLGVGKIKIADREINIIKAQSWMDHEIISSDVKDAKLGWDWFAIQLDDGRELMLYNLKYNGKTSEYSKGTLINKDGDTELLKLEDYKLIQKSTWKSQKTSINYPSKWQVIIPKLNLNLTLEPTVLQQELDTQNSTGKTYWEGRHQVFDDKQNKIGSAYVELVGYE